MSITIHSLKNGATIGYGLPLITGEVKQQWEHSAVEVSGGKDEEPILWPVYNGHFKALVALKPGENCITIRYCDNSFILVLYYKVPQTDLFIRPVYIKCTDDAGHFQGPEDQDCSVESAQRRISLGARLLQTFTAEKLNEHGFGYKTFVLENDLYEKEPECHVFTSKLTLEQAHTMDNNQLWLHFAKELMGSRCFILKDKCKWLAYLSFTRYQIRNGMVPKTHSEVLESTKGHTALGGGGLAVYGTGTLHCWPETLDKVSSCLTDSRRIDRTKFMDDSAYREFYWANYSTGLGASLHELGHTFDLAHTPTGIMARGFDDIYRVFLVHQPSTNCQPSISNSRSASPVPYSPKQSPLRQQKSLDGKFDSHPHRSSSCLNEPKPPRYEDAVKIVQTEAAFRRLRGPSKHVYIQNNYDGTQIRKSVTRYSDGTELVTQITSKPDGEQIIQEHLQHTATNKSRSTLSMSIWQTEHDQSSSDNPSSSEDCTKRSSNQISSASGWQQLCNNGLRFQELRCRDGGAHWYRSSAVLLRYHKWFNPLSSQSLNKMPFMDRNRVQAEAGIRLIELRSQPGGVVFHHWEFIQEKPPTEFILKPSQIRNLVGDVTIIGILIEDNEGNIFKKKLHVDELEIDGSNWQP